MTPELEGIVEDAYRVFARYTLDRTLIVCHCNCCMTEEVERELVATPLRSVPSQLLAEYTNSAHAWDDDRVAREMRHFLPRYFDLIAHDDPPSSLGLDICLNRIGDTGWRSKWSADEVHLIDSYFDALLRASLLRLDLTQWPVGWRLTFDLLEVLTLVVTAGGDLPRVLAAWDAAPDPAAAIHMAALRQHVLVTQTRTHIHSPFLENHREAADSIGAFLMRPEVGRRIEAAVFATPDPRLQQILSDALRP